MSFADAAPVPIEADTRQSPNFRALRRLMRRPVAVVAILIIVVIYGAGILAPWVAPYGFNDADFQNRYAEPSLEHPLGTDSLGRDLLSRAIWSAQTTVIVSVAAVLTGGLFLGVTAGLAAGYAGGRTDSIIMRAADTFASVPTILLVLIITATLLPRVIDLARDVEDLTGADWIVSSGAPSYFLVFGALAIFGWTGIARVVRSQVLALRQEPYVTAARASGAGTMRILFVHLLPNLTNLLLVAFTLSFGALATAEVGLTFLGIGVQPPHPSFGLMISEGVGLSNVREHPMLIIVPGMFIVLLVMSFNLLGDQLTDVLSPRHR
ncbi:MAG: ABC transporter permease [Chloroflexi bacterium]|nr:ABC transporter permease [Chloroflexota bacterium]